MTQEELLDLLQENGVQGIVVLPCPRCGTTKEKNKCRDQNNQTESLESMGVESSMLTKENDALTFSRQKKRRKRMLKNSG